MWPEVCDCIHVRTKSEPNLSLHQQFGFSVISELFIYLFTYFSIQLNSEIKTINISYESPLDLQTCGGQTLRWPSLPTSRDSCSHMIFSSQGRSDLAKLIACPFNAKVSQGTDVTLSDSSLLTLMKQEATSWRGPCNQKWSRAPSQQRAESCSRPSNNSRDLWTTCQQPQELGDGPFHSQGVRWDLSPTQDLEFTPGESPLLPSGSSSGAKSLLSCPTLCDPMDCSPVGFVCPWDSPGKKTGVGCHALLQGIFLTQGLNLHLLSLLHLQTSGAS